MQEIKSRKNPLVVHMKKLGADGAYRRERGEFLCDGVKLLREAVQSGADIRVVFTCGYNVDKLPEDVAVYSVGQDIIEAVSPLKTPQEVVFSCAVPARTAKVSAGDPILILEGIQDPGNVGTILRTADAFGIKTVILTGSCADPYNPKTVRATMGAIFRQHIPVMELEEIAALKESGLCLYGAALGLGSRDIREVSFESAAVAIGSEGRGLSDALLALCDETILIPMVPDSESLNAAVAASIVMWEMRKGAL